MTKDPTIEKAFEHVDEAFQHANKAFEAADRAFAQARKKGSGTFTATAVHEEKSHRLRFESKSWSERFRLTFRFARMALAILFRGKTNLAFKHK